MYKSENREAVSQNDWQKKEWWKEMSGMWQVPQFASHFFIILGNTQQSTWLTVSLLISDS